MDFDDYTALRDRAWSVLLSSLIGNVRRISKKLFFFVNE